MPLTRIPSRIGDASRYHIAMLPFLIDEILTEVSRGIIYIEVYLRGVFELRTHEVSCVVI
jgi:hypothetical protein